MRIPTARIQILLLFQVVFLAGAALSFRREADRLPHGRFWPAVVLGLGGAATGPAGAAFRLARRSRRLRRARVLRLGVRQIPRKPDQTYLGEGFVWGPAHAEGLNELSSRGILLPTETRDRIAGEWLIHGLGADRQEPLFLPDSLLNQHLFLMGAPGSGKTRALELLIEQAVRRGDAVVVIDPKGDEGLLDRTYSSAVEGGREAQFRILALPYPHSSARYNPLRSFLAPSDVADRICSIMPKDGASESFRNFAWQFVSTVATALDRLGEEVSLVKLERYCFRETWRLLSPMIRLLCPDVQYSGNPDTYLASYRVHCIVRQTSWIEIDQLVSMVRLDREYFAKVAGALKNVLTKLTTESMGYLLSPGDGAPPGPPGAGGEAPELSWGGIDRDRLVVYFFLGSLIGPDSASATARLALADLMSYVGRKYAFDDASRFGSRRLTVIVDEVADALAPESVNILNKARGAGLSLVMAGQSLADLEVALGGPADARRALANMGTFLAFRAANPDDARYFSEKVGVRPLPAVTRGVLYEPSGLSGHPKGLAGFGFRTTTSVSRRSEPLLPTSALDRLARFHYFGLWGGELRKGLLPLLDPPEYLYSRKLKAKAQEAVSPLERERPSELAKSLDPWKDRTI